MLERLSKSHRNLALFALALLLGWFAWTVRAVLNPLILGYLLAYILRPMVQRLQDRGIKRRNAVNIIFVLFGLSLLLIVGGVFVQGRQFVNAQIELAHRGEDPFTKAEKNLNALLGRAGEWFDKAVGGDAEGDSGVDTGDGVSDTGASGTEAEADGGAGDSDETSRSGPTSPAGGEPESAPIGAPGGSTGTGGAGASEPTGSSAEVKVPAVESKAGQHPEALGDAASATGNGAAHQGSQQGSQPGAEEGAGTEAEQKEGESDSTDDTSNSKDGAHSELTVRELVRAWVADLTKGETGETGYAKAQVLLGYVQRVFGGVLSVLGFLLLLPVYTYFLLFELERIHTFVRSHVPKRERERVARIGRNVGAVIANFFRGRLLISILKGLIIAVGLTLLNVPYGFLLGMFAGIFSLVPFVGPTVGFGLTVLVALQQADIEQANIWLNLGLIVGIFLLAEGIEGYVLVPKILGDSLGLHPVVILVSVFVGGAALGLFGFLIAIPLAATLIILFRELVMPAIEDFAEEDSHTDDPQAGKANGAEATVSQG